MWPWQLGQSEHGLDHPLHLVLLGPSVAADGLLHRRRRILGAPHVRGCACDQRRAAGLSHGEGDSGIGAHVGLLQGNRLGGMANDQLGDLVVDLLQTRGGGVARRRLPPPVLQRLEPTVLACLYDPEPARCRARIDAENLHESRLGVEPDVPPGPPPAYERTFAFTPGFAAHHSRRWPNTLARCSVSLSGRSGDQRTTTSTTSSVRRSLG